MKKTLKIDQEIEGKKKKRKSVNTITASNWVAILLLFHGTLQSSLKVTFPFKILF